MTYLLDTHTLLWIALFPELLSGRVRELIEDRTNTLLTSSISAFEIATKVRIGKLPEGAVLEAEYTEFLSKLGIGAAPLTTAIALRAGRLAHEHRDPFDRILCATALVENIDLLSKDAALDSFGVRRIW